MFQLAENEHITLIEQIYEKMIFKKLSLSSAATDIGISRHTLEFFLNKEKRPQLRTVFLVKAWIEEIK
mgnify:CR=1 FL=1